MKTFVGIAVCLLVSITSFAAEVRIAVGMSRDDAVTLIKTHGGTDITSGLQVVGPKGEWPLTGVYWHFRDYDAIITLSVTDGMVTGMTFWNKKDFGVSKSRRAKTEQGISVLIIDTKKASVSVERIKPDKTVGQQAAEPPPRVSQEVRGGVGASPKARSNDH